VIEELRGVVGPEGILAGQETRVYECDAFTVARSQPEVVVLPRSTEQVQAILRIAHREGISVVPRGAGTGLSGGALALEGGIQVVLTRMNRILEVDLRNRTLLAEAGAVNMDLTRRVCDEGYHYAPDPSSQHVCTLGGNVAENSGGPHTLKYGVTVNHILGLELVLPTGEAVWLGGRGEDVEGLDLVGLTVGSEGTFGIVTQVCVRLVPTPQAYRTLLAIFPTVDQATSTVSDIIGAGIIPGALEMMDNLIIRAVEAAFHFGFPVDAGAVLICELDGLEAGLDALADRVRGLCKRNGASEIRSASEASERAALWKARKRGIGATGRLAPSCMTQDGVIPRTRLPEVLRKIAAIADEYGLRIANVFHAGDGNLHPVVLFDERDPDQLRRALAAGSAILEECVRQGGSITGEHGIGMEKMEHMSLVFSPQDLELMARVKAVFNPDGRLNPGKLFPTNKSCIELPPVRRGAVPL
jgi:glycolate oxidase